ncbi:MAG: hypothetical protein ACOC2U_03120 [bacterium]
MNWQKQVENFLFTKKAPRILTAQNLFLIAKKYKSNISKRTLERWIQEQINSERFDLIKNGVYINNLIYPIVSPLEAIPHIVPDAVVSLQFVLGEFGVMNNYTDIATCVIPTKTYSPEIKNNSLRFQFNMISEEILNAGEEKDRLLDDKKYQMATPEKAFLDMLYLGSLKKSKLTVPPMDCDLDNLKKRRLNRLIKAMNLEKEFDIWMNKKQLYDNDPNVNENISVELRF